MYDKVKLFYPRRITTPDINVYLDNVKEQTNLKTGEINTFGSINGLKVSSYIGGISIIGSLPKFLYGSNVYPFDIHTTEEAIEKLSDELHLNLETAKVTGMEFGTHFAMRKPVRTYIRKLGDMPRMLRYQFEADTLYYKSKGKHHNKEYCIYDKRKEIDDKNVLMPEDLNDANLLRYEMRLNGYLARQLREPEVLVSTLYKKDFYRKLMQMWKAAYFSITKSNPQTYSLKQIKSVSDAFKVLEAYLFSKADIALITAFLDELKDAKTFGDRKYYSRLKKKINKTINMPNCCTTSEDMEELDNKIMNVGADV